MKTRSMLTGLMTLGSIAAFAGCTAELSQTKSPATLQPVTQIVTQQSEKPSNNANIYKSTRYDFQLTYPQNWRYEETADKNAVSFHEQTSAPQDKKDGAILNMDHEISASDLGLGMRSFKQENMTSDAGIDFTLNFMEQDPTFYEDNNEKADLNKIIVGIDSKTIPGITVYSYDKTVTPNGEELLKQMLKSVKPL